jgi:hypothetical protein
MEQKPTFYDACRLGDKQTFINFLKRDPSLINFEFNSGRTTVHMAVIWFQPEILECLCVFDANLTSCDNIGYTALYYNILSVGPKSDACFRILVANGVRLRNLSHDPLNCVSPWQRNFERGVLRCRRAVVAMLRVKKAAKLHHVDKYLMREIGYAIWATRYDERAWSL